MLRNTITLLFCLILAPALRAQMTHGTGTLVATIGDKEIIIDVASTQESYRLRYVHEATFALAPFRYRFHQTYRGPADFNLQPAHREVERLEQAGWEVVNTDHSIATSENDFRRVKFERMTWFFRVPLQQEDVKTAADVEGGSIIAYDEVNEQASRIRARQFLLSDDTYTFEVAEKKRGTWQPILSLEDEAIAAGEMASQLKAITVDEQQLVLSYELATGDYHYFFQRMGTDYLLQRIQFKSVEDCGILKVVADYNSGVNSSVTTFFRNPEDCQLTSNPKSIAATQHVPRQFLSRFTPFINELPLEKIGKNLTY